jgi:hypothetical protein
MFSLTLAWWNGKQSALCVWFILIDIKAVWDRHAGSPNKSGFAPRVKGDVNGNRKIP